MKKLFALLLALCMMMALCACGGSSETIIGSWEGTMDMAQMLVEEVDPGVQQSLGTSISFGDYLKKMPCKFLAEFKADGTYSYQLDGSDSRDLLKTATYDYYYAILTELLGAEPTDDELVSVLGMSLDDYAGQIADQSLDGLKSQGTTSGTFKIDGNKILYNGSSDNYETFTLSGNTLTIHVDGLGDVVFNRK